jgi:tetratricopeptide (TPR) repeat protein
MEVENKTRIFGIYSSIAELYTAKKEYNNAIKILEKKLELSKEWCDKISIASTVAEIGHVYRKKGDYTTAIEFFEECISLQKELGRTDIDSIFWIGNIHHIWGDFDKAMKNYKMSYDCFQQSRHKMGVAYLAECFGNLYRDMGDYDKAMAYYDEAIELTAKTLKRMLPNRLLKKLELLFLMESFNEAESLSEEITKLGQKVGYDYDALFHNLLSAKIAFVQDDKTAPNRLYEMLEQTEDDDQIATLHYELWKMVRQTSKVFKTFEVFTAEDHRKKALEVYQQLYEKTPKFEYKKRIEKLQE